MIPRDRWAFPAPLLVVLGAALWGTTGTTQALGPDAATPLQVGALRDVSGALALLALVVARGRLGEVRAVLRGSQRPAALVATVAIAAYPLLFFAGVARAGVALGTLVGIGSVPITTGLLARLRGERLHRRWSVGTALSLAGVALLIGPAADAVDVGGLLLAVGAGTAYGVFTLASKRVLDGGHSATATMTAAYLGAGLLLSPLLVVTSPSWVVSGDGVLVSLWLGLGTVAVAYVLYARGLARLPAATVASLTLAEPLTATILAVAVLGERLTGLATVGAGLVALGLLVVSLRRPVRS